MGDVFTVNATTHLSTGEQVLFQVFQQPHHAMKNSPGWFSGDVQNLTVIPGQNGINATSFTVNTQSFYTDLNYVTESAISENTTDFIKLNITE